jgi:hypothetical protein
MKIIQSLLVLSVLFFSSRGLQAQLQEKKILTLEAAERVAAAAEAEAKKRNATVVIVVVDDGGYPIVLKRLNDTQVASVDVGIGKARTAAIFRRPSKTLKIRSCTVAQRRSFFPEPPRFKEAFPSCLMARSLARLASAATRRRRTKT